MNEQFVVMNIETGEIGIWIGYKAFINSSETVLFYYPFVIEHEYVENYLAIEDFKALFTFIGKF